MVNRQNDILPLPGGLSGQVHYLFRTLLTLHQDIQQVAGPSLATRVALHLALYPAELIHPS